MSTILIYKILLQAAVYLRKEQQITWDIMSGELDLTHYKGTIKQLICFRNDYIKEALKSA